MKNIERMETVDLPANLRSETETIFWDPLLKKVVTKSNAFLSDLFFIEVSVLE